MLFSAFGPRGPKFAFVFPCGLPSDAGGWASEMSRTRRYCSLFGSWRGARRRPGNSQRIAWAVWPLC